MSLAEIYRGLFAHVLISLDKEYGLSPAEIFGQSCPAAVKQKYHDALFAVFAAMMQKYGISFDDMLNLHKEVTGELFAQINRELMRFGNMVPLAFMSQETVETFRDQIETCGGKGGD